MFERRPAGAPPLAAQTMSELARARSEGSTSYGAYMSAHEESQPLESAKTAMMSSGHASVARGANEKREPPEA